MKLVKPLLVLKHNFILQKKSFSYFFKTSAKIFLKENSYRTLVTEQPNNVNYNRNKHNFEQTVNHTKLIAKSSILSTLDNPQLISVTNKEQMKTDCKVHTFNLNFIKSISNNTVTSRKYSSECPPPSCVGRHRYHEETEHAINRQILAELNACYAYLSMACYFGRTEVALPGCHGFFMKMHHEEHDHALIFINYQLMRGGHVQLCPLTIPECQNWEGIRKALAVAVEMEKLVKEKLIQLYNIAEKQHDLHVMDLVTTKFMEEQERSICEISRLFIRATQMGSSGIADYLFDKEVHRAFVKKSHKHKDNMEDEVNKSDLYI